MGITILDSFKAIVEDAFRDAPFNKRQDKAAPRPVNTSPGRSSRN